MTIPDSPRRSRPDAATIVRVTVAVILGSIGAAAGFKHTHDWAVHNGQHGWLAWADAVVIEGMAIMAGLEIQRDRRRPGPHRLLTFPVVVLVVAFGIQMTAQVALAPRTLFGWLAAAMPALGFLIVVKLLLRHPAPEPVESDFEPAAPVHTRPTTPDTATPALDLSPRHPAGVLAKLPTTARDAVTAATADAHTAGRPITADDITARINLPAPMVTTLVDELNTTVNHHPITT
ncbi:DUF2637 domain-containing protein [Amycolatopsis magusensis]|uniref:DUF2637 domain-containing protein n=1 Tax=Amycolatopsis magusensis TaxID=882444 RepID=UPI003C2AB30C